MRDNYFNYITLAYQHDYFGCWHNKSHTIILIMLHFDVIYLHIWAEVFHDIILLLSLHLLVCHRVAYFYPYMHMQDILCQHAT